MSAIEIDEQTVDFLELGDLAEGSIEAGDSQQERLEEFTERVGSGEFHIATDLTIPCGCIDGRCGCSPKPNSAGGTESLMVADDLTDKQFRASDDTTLGAYDNVVRFLKKSGYPIGGHDDEGRADDKTGCGANDKLALMYDVIARKGDAIRTVAESIGIEVSDDTHQLIMRNAAGRTDFSAGPELLALLEKYAGTDAVDNLRGSHREVLALINLRAGTTLDRDALTAEFGDDYQAFNVDAWSFHEAAAVMSTSRGGEEQRRKAAAMTYYNLAAALVLGGPKLRIVVLD